MEPVCNYSFASVIPRIMLVSFLLASILAGCGTSPGEQKTLSKAIHESKKGSGKIVFGKEIHNFGTLKDGETVVHSFVFKNEGDGSLTISKAEASCGCLTIKMPTEAIAPGDSAALEVTFMSAGEWGNIIKEIEVETSNGEHKVLHIGAYVENEQFKNQLITQ